MFFFSFNWIAFRVKNLKIEFKIKSTKKVINIEFILKTWAIPHIGKQTRISKEKERSITKLINFVKIRSYFFQHWEGRFRSIRSINIKHLILFPHFHIKMKYVPNSISALALLGATHKLNRNINVSI